MSKLLGKPEEIKVVANIEGVPLSLAKNGKVERVTRVYQRWHSSDQWCDEKVTRDCFTVKTSSGLVYDIYHDTTANSWYLGQVHD